MNEAASVEGAQDWIGVSFGPSFARPPYNWFEPEQALVYREHRKASKANLVPGAVLDWPRKWRGTRQVSADQIVSQLDTDPKFSIYYRNTRRFIEFSEKNKDWFQNAGNISVTS